MSAMSNGRWPVKVVLLLPATVHTGDTPFITPRDPEERLRQYCRSLQMWIDSQLGVPIVFAENSGADLTSLEAIVSRSNYGPGVEMISFRDNDMAITKGKGQGEIRTFEQAVVESETLRDAQLVWKVTGRYFVRNGQQLLTRTLQSAWEGLHFDLAANLTFADTRCFFAEPRFLSEFLVARREEIDDLAGVYLEHATARAIHAAMAEGWKWQPLAVSPNLMGIAGVSGQSYDRTLPRRIADSARRRVFTNLLARS